jgi:methionyl-tRNA formyltransferase
MKYKIAVLTSWGGIFPIPILEAIKENPNLEVVKVISQGIYWKRIMEYSPEYYLNYKDNVKRKIDELNWAGIYTEVSSVNNDSVISELKKIKIDYVFSVSYGEIIKSEFLNTIAPVINFHPGLLPENKGADPFASILLNKTEITGISIHFMDEEIDSGKILLMEKIKVSKNETYSTLQLKVGLLGASSLASLVSIINKPKQWFRKENQSISKYYKKPSKNDYLFELTMSSDDIKVKIDTFSNSPNGAYFIYNGNRISPGHCQIVKSQGGYEAGYVIDQGYEYLIVQSQDYPIIFTDIKINDLCRNISLQLMNNLF